MAGMLASMAIKYALDKLSSLLPVARIASPLPTSSSSIVSSVNQDLEDLGMLERTMRRIHSTLHDAEEHWNIREESAKLRLKELNDLAYDAEYVVDEYEYEVNRFKCKRKRHQVNGKSYSTEAGIVAVPSELVVRARKVIERFSEIKYYTDSFSLSDNDGERRIVPDIHSVRQTSSFVVEGSVLGREQDKEKVIEMLKSGEGSRVASCMSVLAIVGTGGLGKTTLAQLVYNDPRVHQSFDLCAWICVSEYFDVQNITLKIISSLALDSCGLSELVDLQRLFAKKIHKKRFLLVLDDIWNERRDIWELLCMPMFTSRVCSIIVTTRSETVAKLVQTMPFYRLGCLSSDESWLLFQQAAFHIEQQSDTPGNLVKIGKSITEKCKGLPLAIKTLGSMLRYESDEMRWRYVLENELWDLEASH